MKKINSVALMLLSFSFLSLQTSSPEETLFKTKGLLLKRFQVRDSNIRTTIYVAIIDPGLFHPDVAGITESYSEGRSAIDVAENGAKVVLGSGFVKSFSPMIPTGFLKIDNSVINPFSKNGYNGIAGIKDDKLLLLTSSPTSSKQVTAGFQTGPFLVIDGRVVYNNTTPKAAERHNRSFIAFNKNGKILAAITVGPISLKELSKFLTSTQYKDLQCRSVLNLSGGGSETLVVHDRASKKIFSYGGYTDNQSAMITFY